MKTTTATTIGLPDDGILESDRLVVMFDFTVSDPKKYSNHKEIIKGRFLQNIYQRLKERQFCHENSKKNTKEF